MSNLQIFNFHESEVRTLVIDEEIWFVAKDVSDILEYSQTSKMIRRLDEDEKSRIASNVLPDANSMARDFIIINESGLYSSILGSKKPVAKSFKKWVTKEVLPKLRNLHEKFYGMCNYNNGDIDNNGFVYIIKDNSNSYYKIGKTVDLSRRLQQLRCGNANIEMYYYLQSPYYGRIETLLHRENEDVCIQGEWFDIEDRVQNIKEKYNFQLFLDYVKEAM